MPAKAGKNHRQILLAVLLAPLKIRFPSLLGVSDSGFRRIVPPHCPRADDVGLPDDVVQSLVRHAVPIQGAPAGRNSNHHRRAAILLILLEKPDQTLAFLQAVLSAVVEPDAPEGHHRFAPVVQISPIPLVPADLHSFRQQLPVIDHLLSLARPQAREVVHHGVGSPVPIRSFPAVGQHRVAVVEAVRANGGDAEPLHEGPVDAVLLHPLEVPQHGLPAV